MNGLQRLLLVLFIGATCIGHAQSKPNIVFILADDLGWSDLACYGNKFHETPNLDRMAQSGMKFTDAYAAAPVCSPTRAAFLTGQAPARLGLTDYIPGKPNVPANKLLRVEQDTELPLEIVTLPELLKAAGYKTALVGKWHLGGKGFEAEKHGFDVVIGANAEGTAGSFFSPYKGKNRAVPLTPGLADEYLTDRLTDEALKFIEQNRSVPFFLFLPHYAVHTPIQGKTNLVEKYEKRIKPGNTQTNATYAAMMESLDESVGRILAKLDELKLAENTLVIFTSDNGGLVSPPVTSNQPLRTGKGNVYEGGIRVPLIVRWPGKIKSSITDAPVSTADFFPTFLEFAGMKLPTTEPIDGVSLVPLLTGAGSLQPRELFWHYPHYSPQGGEPGGAIREGDFKLVQMFEEGRIELYNLSEDIGETKNLAETNPEKALELVNKLDLWRRTVGAQMMLPNPGYKSGKQAE